MFSTSCESTITDPSAFDAEIEKHRAEAEAKLGPVDRLTQEVSHVITIKTVWTPKPKAEEPPADADQA